MKINDDHMYHGAALTQIAEHEQFTAINVFEHDGRKSRSAFIVNHDIGVYLKYAGRPVGRYKEYQFTFLSDHLGELDRLDQKTNKVFVALVCVKDRQICVLSLAQLRELLKRREKSAGRKEGQYVIGATLPEGKAFRVYVNTPGKRGETLGKAVVVTRNKFPNALFEQL